MRKISAECDDRRNSVNQGQRFFQKFRSRNYSLEDKPRPERSVELGEDVLQILIVQNSIVTVDEPIKDFEFGLLLTSTYHRRIKQTESMGSATKMSRSRETETIQERYAHQ